MHTHAHACARPHAHACTHMRTSAHVYTHAHACRATEEFPIAEYEDRFKRINADTIPELQAGIQENQVVVKLATTFAINTYPVIYIVSCCSYQATVLSQVRKTNLPGGLRATLDFINLQ